MPLTVYGFHDRTHDFAVTKIDAPLDQCKFLLDFGRSIERRRWFFGWNKWVGVTAGLLVPVVHQGEETGGFVFGIDRGEPYFADLPKLWEKHSGSRRTVRSSPVEGLELIADFATHFPDDCS